MRNKLQLRVKRKFRHCWQNVIFEYSDTPIAIHWASLTIENRFLLPSTITRVEFALSYEPTITLPGARHHEK